MIGSSLSESDLVASITKESFYEFVKEFWDVIIHDSPVWNWHVEYLCNELQIVCERIIAKQPKEYDLLINVPPGSTKSTIFSRMLLPWLWTRMPDAVGIFGSYEIKLSRKLGRGSKDIITSEKYKECFPNIKIRRDVDANSIFGNTLGGERISCSVMGTITGEHGHLICIDDPINPLAASSEVGLNNVNEWMSETIPSRAKTLARTPIILIMQRLHQDDPSENMRKSESVKHICLPAELKDNEVKPKKLRRKYVNGLLDPIRLSKEDLAKQKKKLSGYAYACQYDQNPVPREGGMFKVDRIKIDVPSGKWKWQVRYWDKAGTKDGGCYTSGFKLAEDMRGVLWIRDVRRGQWEAGEREDIILQTAEADGKDVIIGIEQEGGSGGKESAANSVRRLKGFRVYTDCPTGDKIIRAEELATQTEHYNVKIEKGPMTEPREDLNGKSLAEIILELFRGFPFVKVKDDVDASSGALALGLKISRVARVGAL